MESQYSLLSTASTIRACGLCITSTRLHSSRSVHGLGLACAIELQVDHDVIGIVARTEDAVTAHARALPADRIAVEGRLPGAVVGDRCSIRRMCIFTPPTRTTLGLLSHRR